MSHANMDDDARKAQNVDWGTNSNCLLIHALSLALHRTIYGQAEGEMKPESILEKGHFSWPTE